MKRKISIFIVLSIILASFSTSYAAFELGMEGSDIQKNVSISNVYKGTGANAMVETALKNVLVDGKYTVTGQVQNNANTTIDEETGIVTTTNGYWQVNRGAASSVGNFIKFSLGDSKKVNAIALHGGVGGDVISDTDIEQMYVFGDDGEKVYMDTAKTKRNSFSAAATNRGKQVVYIYFNKPVETVNLTMGFDVVLTASLRACEICLWYTGDNKLVGQPVSNFYPVKSSYAIGGTDIGTDSTITTIDYILTDGDRTQTGGIGKWCVTYPTRLNSSPYVEYNVNTTINKLVVYSGYQSAHSWVIPENVCITYTNDGTNWKTAKILDKTANLQKEDVTQGWVSTYTIGAINPKSIRIYVPYGRGHLNYAGVLADDGNQEEFRIREVEAYFDESFTESHEDSIFALRMDETSDYASAGTDTFIRKDAVISKGEETRTFMLQFPTPVSNKTFTVNNKVVTPTFSTQSVPDTNGTGTVYAAVVTVEGMTEGTNWTIKADGTDIYNFSVQKDFDIDADFADADGTKTYSGTITNNTSAPANLKFYLVAKNSDNKLLDCDDFAVDLAVDETKDISLAVDSAEDALFSVFLWDTEITPLSGIISPNKAVSLNDEALSYYGRWSDIDGAKYANWNHPYVKFDFTGTDLAVDAENVEYLTVTIDNAQKTYTNVNGLIDVAPENLSDKKHTAQIKIYKSSLAQNQAIKGIYIGDGEEVSKVPETTNVLQFIGDSITTDPASYSYTIPRKLGYDFSIISLSGIALQDGCGWYQKKVNLPTTELAGMESAYFNLQNPLFDATSETCTKYDFANENPNVIVVNIGTNDNEYIRLPDTYSANGKTPETYINSYVAFINKVRTQHPDADIYLMENLIQTENYTTLINAQAEVYNQLKADEKIHFIDTTSWNVQSDDNIHPTKDEYARLCDVVADAISASFK